MDVRGRDGPEEEQWNAEERAEERTQVQER
jgi:hypothetical protein